MASVSRRAGRFARAACVAVPLLGVRLDRRRLGLFRHLADQPRHRRRTRSAHQRRAGALHDADQPLHRPAGRQGERLEAGDRHPRADRGRGAGRAVLRLGVLGHPPGLDALRRAGVLADADHRHRDAADDAAERHRLRLRAGLGHGRLHGHDAGRGAGDRDLRRWGVPAAVPRVLGGARAVLVAAAAVPGGGRRRGQGAAGADGASICARC